MYVYMYGYSCLKCLSLCLNLCNLQKCILFLETLFPHTPLFIMLCIYYGFLYLNLVLRVSLIIFFGCCPWQWNQCVKIYCFLFSVAVNYSEETCSGLVLSDIGLSRWKCNLNTEQIIAYLSLLHSSINASKSSHLNSWKKIYNVSHLYFFHCGLGAEMISEERSWKEASIAVIPVTAVSEILSYAYAGGVC